VTTRNAVGWVYAPERHEEVAVQAVLSHEVIGDAVANDHRPDLAAVGLGKGNCGYTIKFYREIDPLYLPFVSVKIDGGDAELPRGGQLGFGEFFSAFHRAHPATGRSRSVLGGLWSDRTDAAAILKARSEIGQITPETAALVGQLIHLGIAIVEPPATSDPSEPSEGAVIAERGVAAIVEEALMLAVLRAVFDDNPLVLSAEAVLARDTALAQPSAESGLPSPAECLVIAAPLAKRDIAVEVVRNSHQLPEFTAAGVSRWADGQIHAGLELAAMQESLMTRYEVPVGSAAIVGPGTIYRLRCTEGADGIKLCCAPARAMPMTLASDGNRREMARKSGVRLWI
jgi:hypothetical protein